MLVRSDPDIYIFYFHVILDAIWELYPVMVLFDLRKKNGVI
jgi:hypothetical protein